MLHDRYETPLRLLFWRGRSDENEPSLSAMKTSPTLDLLGRSLLALLVAVLVGLGAVVPHDAAAEASGVQPWQEVSQAATHPNVPEHIEAAAVESHAGCTGCLIQLQSQSLLGFAPLALTELPRGAACPIVSGPILLRVATRFGPARAPPASLLSA